MLRKLLHVLIFLPVVMVPALTGGCAGDTRKGTSVQSAMSMKPEGAPGHAFAHAGTRKTAVSAPSSPVRSLTYAALPETGLIGRPDGKPGDDPSDNIFTVDIDSRPETADKAWLCYETAGSGQECVIARSINDRLASGAFRLQGDSLPRRHREEIDGAWLHKGRNRILFALQAGSRGVCRVSRLSVLIEKATVRQQLVVTEAAPAGDGFALIRGFVRGEEGRAAAVTVGGEKVACADGEFEARVQAPAGSDVRVEARDPRGKTLSVASRVTGEAFLPVAGISPDSVKRAAVFLRKGQPALLSVAEARLTVQRNDMEQSRLLSISTLRHIDLPALETGMTNVTLAGEGYRFLPHGNHFAKGAQVSLGYDPSKIPDGFTEDDIRTYYFDPAAGHWQPLRRDSLDRSRHRVVSRTTHFTDMINGVVKTPESPETSGFAPTMMNDLKPADPALKIALLAPPTANSRGTASTHYAFEAPPGRNGMQAQAGISYSSDRADGWLGEGWDMDIPSITVETRWGVPRYSATMETETYLLDGEPLLTTDNGGNLYLAHRDQPIPRGADRQFYTRREGEFMKIVRKGDAPGNYYWELTDKQGVKYTYGGSDASLSGTVAGAGGATRQVIAEWKLKRIEELHGDYVQYAYTQADEPVRGNLVGKALYPVSVSAGIKGANPHTEIDFVSTSVKHKQTNSARFGFLTSENRLLDSVTVKFEGETLRSYSFAYRQGAFDADLLASFTHRDADGNEVATHRMDYYDDTRGTGQPFANRRQEAWRIPDDNLGVEFATPVAPIGSALGVSGFSTSVTGLGGSTTKSMSGSLFVGVGPNNADWVTKSATVGGSFSYSNAATHGIASLIDINGDGLPDKVFVQNGRVWFRPCISREGGTPVYGDVLPVKGISKISENSSNVFSYGLKAYGGIFGLTASAGKDWQKTTSTTSVFFTDVNNDGLMDLVTPYQVLFNHLEKDASGMMVPVFTSSSGDTPAPVNASGEVDTSDTEVDPSEQADLIKNSPMQDVVRVWEAPFDGTVNIDGSVQLQPPAAGYDADAYGKADGVRVAIQKAGSELWSMAIARGDNATYTASPAGVAVKKGDRLYFRVQSGSTEMSNGAFDKVTWNPTVSYTETSRAGRKDADGKPAYAFNASASEVINAPYITRLPYTTDIAVNGNFVKPVTSDSITLRVLLSNNTMNDDGTVNTMYNEKTVFIRKFAGSETYSGDLSFAVTNDIPGQNLRFSVESPTNVDWSGVKWHPVIAQQSNGSTQNTMGNVSYPVFARQVTEGEPFVVAADSTISLLPALVWKPSLYPLPSGMVTLSVKQNDSLLFRKNYPVTAGILPAANPADTVRIKAGEVWIELYTAADTLAARADSARVLTGAKTMLPSVAKKINFFSKRAEDGFGTMYRGWGHFVYSAGGGRYASPIDESLLKMPDGSADPDPLNMPFAPMSPDGDTKSFWIGQTVDAYVRGDTLTAARVGTQDVVMVNPLAAGNAQTLSGDCLTGSGAPGITLVNKSSSSCLMASLVGITGNKATGNSYCQTAYMDMNGDGFPDVVTPNQMQMTTPTGRRDGEIVKGVGSHRSESSSYSLGYGGNPIHTASVCSNSIKLVAARSVINNPKSGADEANKAKDDAANARAALEKAKSKTVFSPSGDVSTNDDHATETFLDVNGDGLPDKITSARQVMLNLGYSFAPPVDWDLTSLESGNGLNFNAGLGIDFGASSIQAGVGVSLSKSKNLYSMADMNGDGLPDKVRADGSTVYVALNNGHGFDAEAVWSGMNFIGESQSTAESGNVAFTIDIPIFFVKLSINPGFSLGQTMNRTVSDIRDIDGDGLPDLVSSDDEGTLTVTRSAIGRTNKLRVVTNPLGGTFTLDYARSAATCDHPGGKWVMNSLTADDGVAGDGPPQHHRFGYAGGRYDRYEREFLGFASVTTDETDDSDNGRKVRSTVTVYDTRSVYTAGNVLSVTVSDGDGKPFSRSENSYADYFVSPAGDNYRFAPTATLCAVKAMVYSVPRYTRATVYNGDATGLTTGEELYDYWLDGNHGELRSYRFSDKGDMGPDGSGAWNYRTDFTYTGNPAKHIYGLRATAATTGSDGKLYRQREMSYDLNYADHLTRLAMTVDAQGTTAVTDWTYDKAGNITKVTLPANYRGQRMWYKYLYDRTYNMYPEQVDDALGYRMKLEDYDYRYGMPLTHTDINGYSTVSTVDNLGRLTSVTAPNELATGAPFTVSYAYGRGYAVTTHYDEQHPAGAGIRAIALCDGWGRPLQVKRDAVTDGSPSVSVSGRTVYDALGRAHKAYYPVSEAPGNELKFNPSFDAQAPTVTEYDALDRAVSVTLPDGRVTVSAYGLDKANRLLATTVTDPAGGRSASFAAGSGRQVRAEQYGGPAGTVTTLFEYDAIDEPVRVTDPVGGVSSTEYDMAGRPTRTVHPAAGEQRLSYDAVGNVLAKTTANLAAKGQQITYQYDYNRLTDVHYPQHPENDEKYYWGNANASYNRVGRVMVKVDGSGAEEYQYGRMGEVTQVRRTMVIPNRAVATYVTRWRYDSWNRVQEMIYPDEEKVSYGYNAAGELNSVSGFKVRNYDYVTRIDYDKFGAKSYIRYGNGTETRYRYDPANRRLSGIDATSGAASIMQNRYGYDPADNITSVANAASGMRHTYGYDGLYRLTSASGTYAPGGGKGATYAMAAEYDNLSNITRKKLDMTQRNVQFAGGLQAGHDLSYTYGANGQQIASVAAIDYRYADGQRPNPDSRTDLFRYDLNGNMTYVNHGNRQQERKMLWDEENRLTAVDDNGYVSNYFYDSDKERTVKLSAYGEGVWVNGSFSGGRTAGERFTAYVNPYMVAQQGGQYTKHIYMGSQRVVSKVGDPASYGADPRRIACAGSDAYGVTVDYAAKYRDITARIKMAYDSLIVPFNLTLNSDYINAQGFVATGTATSAEASYFYHPDHLGSSNYITTDDGSVSQHLEYLPYGDTFIDERYKNWHTPYTFSGKERDEETGLLYVSRRYQDGKLGVWLSVDELRAKYPNMGSYVYCHGNPVNRVDPDGNTDYFTNSGKYIKSEGAQHDICIGDHRESLSSYLNRAKGNMRIAMRVLFHYVDKLGYSGKFGIQDMESTTKGAYTSPQDGSVYFNMKKFLAGRYNNYNDLTNALEHEANMQWGHKGQDALHNDEIAKFIANYTYTAHTLVYMSQAQTAAYANSSNENQFNVTYGFANHLWNAVNSGELTQNEAKEQINVFNQQTTGNTQVSLEFSKNLDNSTIQIRQNGKTSNNGVIPIDRPNH
jgi:RHS repeat-associated protein